MPCLNLFTALSELDLPCDVEWPWLHTLNLGNFRFAFLLLKRRLPCSPHAVWLLQWAEVWSDSGFTQCVLEERRLISLCTFLILPSLPAFSTGHLKLKWRISGPLVVSSGWTQTAAYFHPCFHTYSTTHPLLALQWPQNLLAVIAAW